MARLLPDLLLDLLLLLVVVVASSDTCEVASDALRHAPECLLLRLLSARCRQCLQTLRPVAGAKFVRISSNLVEYFYMVGVFSLLALLACCTTANNSTSSTARTRQALSAQALRKRT